MDQCGYVYCRAFVDPTAPHCSRCGHPRDPAALRTPEYFVARVAELPPRPRTILDLHQILPAHPRIAAYQLLAMDQLGIARALLQSAPAEATSLSGNDALDTVRQAHPDRFWASWFLDPRFPGAIDALRARAAAGTRVIKLLPVAGWQASDPAFEPFFAVMEELGLVAMVHTGFFTARHQHEEAAAGVFLSSALADPLQFDRLCRRFPRLCVILCHAGGALWFEHAAEMVTQHDHVWADVSGSGVFALHRLLRGVAVDWSKLFWGNDAPPFAYPLNLRLLLGTLAEAGAERLAAPLLYDNGARFAERWLDR